MKSLSAVLVSCSMVVCFGIQEANAFRLDDSPITVTAKKKNVEQTKKALLPAMQSKGYKIEKSDDVLEFRRALKGLLGILSAGERLQQEDVVNCFLSSKGDDTVISCRTFIESVNRKGIERRTEKTQALGYRKKLVAELNQVNSDTKK